MCFLSSQANLLSVDENKALPPKQLQKKLSAMLEEHPDIAEAVSGHKSFGAEFFSFGRFLFQRHYNSTLCAASAVLLLSHHLSHSCVHITVVQN